MKETEERTNWVIELGNKEEMLGDPGIRKISEDVIDENHMKLGEPGMSAMSEEQEPQEWEQISDRS